MSRRHAELNGIEGRHLPLVTPVLDFDPEMFGVDVASGSVDGNRIGILSATVCAISRHSRWQAQPSRPAEIKSILGSPLDPNL